METKICKKCNLEKELVKLRTICKDCFKVDKIKINKKYNNSHKEERSDQWKVFYENNKEKETLRKKKFYTENPDIVKLRNKNYISNNKDKVRSSSKEYRKNNSFILNRKERERRLNDPNFRIRVNIKSSIRIHLKNILSSKGGKSTFKYLPYSLIELKEHLEKQFEPWMNWTNNGMYKINEWNDNDESTWKWQLDHIIPHSTFKYTSMEDQAFKDCWVLSNLRPYSAKLNILEGDRR